jgi:tetratricopeptide (TPR) repeat protein
MVVNEVAGARADVDRYRRLVEAEGDAHVPALAGSLTTLEWQLGTAGQFEEACAVAREAIELYRRREDLVGWAKVLADLPRWLSARGNHEAAIGAAYERVAVARRLCAWDDSRLPTLAAAQRGLGDRLAGAGDRWAALAATEEAVWLYRAIGYRRHSGFIVDLADILIDLDRRRSDVDDYRGAAAAAREAVDIYTRLVEIESPERYQRPLASALNDLGADLSRIGETESALEAFERSLSIYRGLVRDDVAVEDGLAMTLRNLGSELRATGRHDEAARMLRESVAAYRSLLADDPEEYRDGLAAALDYLGQALADVADHDAALDAGTESVALYRALAEDDTGFEVDLAEALDNLGNRLAEVGRTAEAVAAAQESVALWRIRRGASPLAFDATHGADLGRALLHLARHLAATGATEALGIANEATEAWEGLAARCRRAHLPGHAEAQLLLGELLLHGDIEEAFIAAETSRLAYRELAARFPARYSAGLTAADRLVQRLRDLP